MSDKPPIRLLSLSTGAVACPGPYAVDRPGIHPARLVVLGGLRILERIEAVGYDVFRHRPTLGRNDWLRLGWRALTFGRTA